MHAPPTSLAALAAGGYVDDAVEGLATANVYVSPEVGGAAAALQEQLEQQIGDASIGVAVFSENAALEASGPEIVLELGAETDYDTIIVAVGDDLSAGSHLEDLEAMRIANEAQGSEDSVEDALVLTVQQVLAAEPAPEADTGIDGMVFVGIVVAVVAVVAAASVFIGLARSRRARTRVDRALPEGVRAQVAALRTLSAEYAAVGVSGSQVAAQTSREIGVLAENVTELFARLDKRNVEDQHSIAAVEYDDKLRKLTAALNRDYLLDILTHPHLWDDPADRVREVQNALEGVSTELVENIKQVNARRGLHFQVSLDGLIGRRKELQDWDREFNSASGTEDGQEGAGR